MNNEFLKYIKEEINIQALESHFKNEYEPFLKDCIETKCSNVDYFGNILIWSFSTHALFPVLVINRNFNSQMFGYLTPLLKKFSFTQKIVECEINEIICFVEKSFKKGDSHWNFWKRIFYGYSRDLENSKNIIEEVSKAFFQDVFQEESNKITQISLIPIVTGTSQKRVSGVLSLYTSHIINQNNLEIIQKYISGIISPISIQELEFLSLQASRKAAISQVMLRNLSHNHGSHVLSRVIHPDQIEESQNKMLEGIRDILSKKYCG
jgi:hypothetical protein